MSTMTPPRDVTIDIMLNFGLDSDAHAYAYWTPYVHCRTRDFPEPYIPHVDKRGSTASLPVLEDGPVYSTMKPAMSSKSLAQLETTTSYRSACSSPHGWVLPFVGGWKSHALIFWAMDMSVWMNHLIFDKKLRQKDWNTGWVEEQVI